ncbi:MAG: hypothetical protein H7Y15_08225 [Pseudonocardia sp.]|nr:hypothetical protein [Pseudonocardia sp.]
MSKRAGPVHVQRAGPALCRLCAFALDPVNIREGHDDHPNCGPAPKSVPLWRRKGALRLTPAQLAGHTIPTEETTPDE